MHLYSHHLVVSAILYILILHVHICLYVLSLFPLTHVHLTLMNTHILTNMYILYTLYGHWHISFVYIHVRNHSHVCVYVFMYSYNCT